MDAAPLAAFDVDGTLATRDTLVPFLRRAAGTAALAHAFGRRPAAVMGTAIGRRGRDQLKAEVLRDLLAGADHDRLERLGHDYGLELAERHLRTDVVERLRWHQREGHTVVLVSASLRYYLAPLAERLRADEVLCTEVEVGADGRLTGRLVGASCRAAEKVARLHARYGPDASLAWAYGDSPGDRELLAAARTGVMIGRRRLTAAPATSVPA